jgi:hypothetical protein
VITASRIIRTISCVGISGVVGCSEATTTPLPPCPADAFMGVVPADTGWRALIQAQVAHVRADTLLEAVVGYRDSVTAADRTLLQAAGAELAYEFTGMPAISIRLSAGGLGQLTAAAGPLPDSRVVYVEIGRLFCLAGARLDTFEPSG